MLMKILIKDILSSSPPCYSNRIARDRVPNSYYKAPSKEEEQYILDYIKN